MKSGWRKRTEGALVASLTVALASFAFAHQGFEAAEVDLNDGGVWVTNGNKMLVAHLNYDSQTLDGGLRAISTSFDLSQYGNEILLIDPTAISPIDSATLTLTGESETTGLDHAHGGANVLVSDPGKGKVWAMSVPEAGGFNPSAEPTAEELDSPRVVVGVGGESFVITAEGEILQALGESPEIVLERIGEFSQEPSKDAQFTVIGAIPVMLDGDTLSTPSQTLTLEGLSDGVLQTPSTAAKQIVIASPSGLWKVPASLKKDAELIETPKGEPVQPAVVGECAFGVWAGTGYYVQDCPEEQIAAQFPELTGLKKPVFRTNRDVVVINDMVSGAAYLPQEAMELVDNWDLVEEQIKQEEEKDLAEEFDDEDASVEQEFSDEQHPPVAVDDEFGARAGTSTTLPVLLNDIDVDGDVLTVILEDTPSDVTVALAKNDRAVHLDVPSDKTGSVEFTYRAFDGKDVSNVANVKVNITSADANQPPERERPSTLNISERATGQYSVLPDWVDPDGDPIFLSNAVGEEGLSVTWRPDGYVSVRDLGTGGPGRRIVDVTVSDGELSTTDQLLVNVMPGTSNAPPVANNDHYTATVGNPVTLRPLANDTDSEGDQLSLADVGSTPKEVEIRPDFETGEIRFEAEKAGNYTFTYTVTDGPNSSKGKIRVDVLDPEAVDSSLSVQNDLALMPSSGHVIIHPLENDYDPTGDVLSVQSISMANAEGINVEVINHNRLRISTNVPLEAAQTFEYTASNGEQSASAKVLVVPLPPQADVQEPVALPDSTVVRAGDIVTIDVLANDYSPSDLPIRLLPELDVRSDEGLGEFFVSGDYVRFKAGEEAGTAEAIYTVSDSENNVASAAVEIAVRDFDESNQHPVPKQVTARTFAGGKVSIPVPVDGIDPDGDSVELLGVGSTSPRLGSVEADGRHIVYTAGRNSAGTDRFSYKVKDRFGAEAEGTINVGVIPRPDENQAPVAVPDVVSARPNRVIEIPVTENDIDPDGDDISLVESSARPVDEDLEIDVKTDGQLVVITTPEEEGVYQFYYTITDGNGPKVDGVITLTVDEDVPLLPPVANDDYVSVSQIDGLEEVEIDVLENDFDPDGSREDLTVIVEEPLTESNGIVTVPLTDDRQVVLYTVEDLDGLTARAAIVVPGKDMIPPFLDPEKVPAVIKGGDTLEIDLDEYVITRPDHSAKITAVDSVIPGQGGDPDVGEDGLEVRSDRIIEFTPDTLFIGTTSVAFEVTDGASVEDPRGLIAQLTLPIEVESSGLFPPELRPSEITVAPGEDPTEASLAAMVDDPDPGDNEKMAYSLVSASAPIDATVTGQSAHLSVPADTPPGTTGSIVVSVHDGTTDPLEMTVPVRVTTSTRPLMIVSDISEPEGRVGKPLSFNLSDHVTNPFADRNEEIEIVGQPSVSGPATVTTDGLNINVTPTDSGSSADGSENVLVTYTVADATKDSSRYKSGTIRVTVKDVPKAPRNVTADAQGSKTARVSWSHSGWRGGKPAGFVVSWPGGSQNCGLQTTCDITTLANNNTYVFTVRAQVSEGDIADSPESSPSNEIFVDVKPDTPVAPRATFGDKKIDLTWDRTGVPDGGSPVTKYTVSISPADAGGRTQQEVSGTSMTWDNLKNGTAYTFKITAHNKLTELDPRVTAPQGPASPPEIPAGAPSNQGAPTVKKDKAAAGVTPRATVSWSAPGNPNGDSSFKYEMRQRGTSEILYSGTSTSSVVSMEVSTSDRTFEVRSTNKSGKWSEWSPASNAVRAFQPPGKPGEFSLSPTGESKQAKFTFAAAPGNGAKSGEVSYQWSAGGRSGAVSPGQSIKSDSFPVGTDVTVSLRAISTVNGETAQGETVTARVNTYGPPSAPSLSAAGTYRAATGTWSMSSSSNGRSVSVYVDNSKKSNSGNAKKTGNFGQKFCFKAYSQNSEGQKSGTVEKCANAWAAPKATMSKGSSTTSCSGLPGPPAKCNKLMLKLERWKPNSNVLCPFESSDGKQKLDWVRKVDGNGYSNGQVSDWALGAGMPQSQDITWECTQK